MNGEILWNPSYYGLFQISRDRRETYENWIRENGLPEEEIVQNQCKFALKEYYYSDSEGWLDRGIRTEGSVEHNGQTFDYSVNSNGSTDDFENAKDPMEAALIWGISFERCIKGQWKRTDENGNAYYTEIQDQKKRCENALEIYEKRGDLYCDE